MRKKTKGTSNLERVSQFELISEETQAQDLIIKNKKSVALLQEKARLETPSPPRTMKNSDTISGDPKMIEVTPDQVR